MEVPRTRTVNWHDLMGMLAPENSRAQGSSRWEVSCSFASSDDAGSCRSPDGKCSFLPVSPGKVATEGLG